MIKATTFVYTEESIQELIDNKEVVRIIFGSASISTMIIKSQSKIAMRLGGQGSPHPDYPGITISGTTTDGIDIHSLNIKDVKRIEVLDDVQSIIWKLKNNL